MGGGSFNFFLFAYYFLLFLFLFLAPLSTQTCAHFQRDNHTVLSPACCCLKGQRDDAFGGAFTHALVRSSSASDFCFRRREEKGGTIESETYRL